MIKSVQKEFDRISNIGSFFSGLGFFFFFCFGCMCLFASVWAHAVCVDACGGQLTLHLIHGDMVSPGTRSPPSLGLAHSGW